MTRKRLVGRQNAGLVLVLLLAGWYRAPLCVRNLRFRARACMVRYHAASRTELTYGATQHL
eukprot:2444801-Rhodomonas_salina.1